MTKETFRDKYSDDPKRDDLTILAPLIEDPAEQVFPMHSPAVDPFFHLKLGSYSCVSCNNRWLEYLLQCRHLSSSPTSQRLA